MLARMRVRTKLMVLLAGICLAALAAACTAFVLYDRMSYAEAKQATLTVLADAVAESAVGAVAFADPESAAYVLKAIEREDTALIAAIYLADGERLTVWTRARRGASAPEQALDLPAETAYVSGQLRVRRPIEKDGIRHGELYAAFSAEDIDARTRHFLSIAGLVLLLAFLGAWGAASMAHVVLTRPVRKLVEAVTAVRQSQDFNIRAEKVSEDELGTLTDAFNEMVGAIQARDAELAAHRRELEDRVEARTRDLDARNAEMRLVLDNVDQGFATIDLQGRLLSERSRAFDDFFAAPNAGDRLWTHVERFAAGFGAAMELGWEAVTDGLLPLELTLEQLPDRLETREGRHLTVEYRPIMDGAALHKALVIFTDISAQVARERSAAEQAEAIAVFEAIMSDRFGFLDFVAEAGTMVQRVLSAPPGADRRPVMRDLHTLKGNFGVSRLHRMAEEIHHIEGRCIDSGALPSKEDREHLSALWEQFCDRVKTFLGDLQGTFSVEIREYEALLNALEREGVSEGLLERVRRLRLEEVGPRLKRLGQEAERLAKRLQRGPVQVHLIGTRARIAYGSTWLWGVLPHLIRNAVDHGYRPRQGFPPKRLVVHLSASEEEDHFVVEVADQGYGIHWERLRELAIERGLPAATEADLVAVMFADQVSTAAEATDISGRGVGLSAVKAEVEAHGGVIRVSSSPGKGTTFSVRVPYRQLTESTRNPPQDALAMA